MLSYLATAACIIAAVLLASPSARGHFPTVFLAVVRCLAFAVGYLFVGLVYIPIKTFACIRPYEVPYLRHRERNLRQHIQMQFSAEAGGIRSWEDLEV